MYYSFVCFRVMYTTLKRYYYQYLTLRILVCVCIVYYGITTLGLVNDFFFPTLTKLSRTLYESYTEYSLLQDIWYSTMRVWLSFCIAFLIWLPLALWINGFKWMRKWLLPWVDFLRYLPVPSLIPISILFFGIGEWSKIFLLVVWTLFPMILLIIDDLDRIPKTYYHLAHSLWRSSWKVVVMKLRSIAPELYDNSRIMIGRGWTYVLIAELVAAKHGVWFFIKEAQRFADTPKIYIGIISIGVVWFMTDYILRRAKPLLFPYVDDWNKKA